MVGLIVEVVGTVSHTIAVHIVVLVSFVAVVIVVITGGAVPMSTATVSSPSMGRDRERDGKNQATRKHTSEDIFSHRQQTLSKKYWQQNELAQGNGLG